LLRDKGELIADIRIEAANEYNENTDGKNYHTLLKQARDAKIVERKKQPKAYDLVKKMTESGLLRTAQQLFEDLQANKYADRIRDLDDKIEAQREKIRSLVGKEEEDEEEENSSAASDEPVGMTRSAAARIYTTPNPRMASGKGMGESSRQDAGDYPG